MPEQTGAIRNDKGQFKKGVSGNPAGRPEGAGISVVTELKRALAEVPEGEKRTRLKMLVDGILQKAIQEGDGQMQRDLIDRIDGKAIQKQILANDADNPLFPDLGDEAQKRVDKYNSKKKEV